MEPRTDGSEFLIAAMVVAVIVVIVVYFNNLQKFNKERNKILKEIRDKNNGL